jgi:uncharacterized membrane protein
VQQRVEGSTETEAPVETVYGYWSPLENLPHFMASVEEVAPATSNTNHWRIKETFGRTLECEARTTHRETNSAIEWNHTRRQHTQWPIC